MGFAKDSNGWYIPTPSTSSKIYYVSDTDGNDGTAKEWTAADPNYATVIGSDPRNPLQEANVLPYKTLSAAYAAFKWGTSGTPETGEANWLLLKRGDTFTQSSPWQNDWPNYSWGLSATERAVFGAYGASTSRPVIQCAASCEGFYANRYLRYWAIIGIEFYSYTRDPNNAAWAPLDANVDIRTGVLIQAGADLSSYTKEDILLEDCKIHAFGKGLVIQNKYETTGDANIWVRRNVIADNTAMGYYQGAGANSCIIEENVIDGNGWYYPGGDREWGGAMGSAVETSFSDGAYTNATRNLYSAGTFANYTWQSGDIIYLNGSGGVAASGYYIESKTDSDNIVLAASSRLTGDATGVSMSEYSVPTIRKHNIYFDNENPHYDPTWNDSQTRSNPGTDSPYNIGDNRTKFICRKNIIANASSHGIQFRCGGLVEDNVFIANPISIQECGGNSNDNYLWENPGGVYMTIQHNAIEEGNHIAYQRGGTWGIRRNIGILVMNNNTLVVFANLMLNSLAFDNSNACFIKNENDNQAWSMTYNVTYQQPNGGESTGNPPVGSTEDYNKLWDYNVTGTNMKSENETFTDASRNVKTYNQALGGAATHAAFLAEMRSQSFFNWRPSTYHASPATTWILAGFDIDTGGSAPQTTFRTRGRMRIRARVI